MSRRKLNKNLIRCNSCNGQGCGWCNFYGFYTNERNKEYEIAIRLKGIKSSGKTFFLENLK